MFNKRLISCLTCVALCLSLAACGGNSTGSTASVDDNTTDEIDQDENAGSEEGQEPDAEEADEDISTLDSAGEELEGESDDTDEDSSSDDSSEKVYESKRESVTVSKSADSLKKGMTLSYPQIDPARLDNTAIPWGMGPDRDELNRPITALQYQQSYQDFNVDFIVPTEEKVIYLTFDEGYENGFTESILDTLNRHNACGIFFATKPYAESRPDLVKRMIDEGHIVGNHTVHHPSDGMQAHDIAYQTAEVTEMHNYIRDNFNYEMCLFRYPTGMFSKQSLAVVSNCGYRSVFWSFAYRDWETDNQPNPQEALAKIEGALHPGAIYLLHAVSETNASILDEFLTYIESQGYSVGNYLDTLDK